MSLFSFRYVAIIGGITIALLFGTGFWHWNRDSVKCFQRRDWSHGSWHTWFAVGKLEFRLKDYGCDPEWKFDPSKWQKDASGNITPK